MDISICIVNWNTRELLSRCIESIYGKTGGIDYEIIVVDNASMDGSARMVKRKFPYCKLVASAANLGFVKANNMALGEASGKYVMFLNPDTELVTNAPLGIFRFLEDNPEFGAAGCRLTGADGSVQYTCASTFPTPFNELSRFLFLNRIFPGVRFFSSREMNYWDHKDSRSVDCLSGACMMVRKIILDSVGGFDEGIYMYAEDLELCYRILKSGWKIYYLASEVIIHHEGSGSRKKKRDFSTLLQNESNLYFMKKYKRPGYVMRYRLAVGAGSLFRVLIACLLFPALWARGMTKKDRYAADLLGRHLSLFLWSIGFGNIKRLL